MSLRERLGRLVGVWEGTYTHLSPRGELLERFPSRQELRLVGDVWHERIVYLREGREPEVLDFKARFEQDRMVFDDPDFHGNAWMIGDDVVLFPYHWKSRPAERVVETVTLPAPGRKARVWQKFDHGELAGVTLIEERFRPDLKPAEWE